MQDRFKFRCFHTLSNKMYEVYSFNKNFIQATESLEVISIRHFLTDNCILEQCTGLKDKSDKLIYEGDIVLAINQDTKDRPDLQIAYIWVDEYGCRWIKFAKEELSWNDFCSLIDYDGTLTIEIIGNIHENTELLERKQ